MKGFRTVLFGLAVAVVAPAITYLDALKEKLAQCGVDPATNTEICGLPGWVGIVIGAVIIGLRWITTTAMFTKK